MELSEKSELTLVTHSGKFHADEVAATAVLKYVFRDKDIQVTRSRNSEIINTADIVYDVGGVYDPEHARYDHHQKGALKRENGMTYSALGLVWRHYGLQYCDGDERAAERIDHVFIKGIDARDNSEISMNGDSHAPDYGISQVIEQLNPILEHGETYDEQFYKAVGRAADILMRLKEKVSMELETEDMVLTARETSADPRYVVLDNPITPPEVLSSVEGLDYLVFPEITDNTWQIYAIHIAGDPFTPKSPFPAEWAGLLNQDIAQVTGVEDAIFCHSKRFLAVAKTKEGALALLEKAMT